MAEEGGKGIALAILGIVAVIAIVGLVLLFAQAKTGQVARMDRPGGYPVEGSQFFTESDARQSDDYSTSASFADPQTLSSVQYGALTLSADSASRVA